ncbi:LysM peptidoglycan-binding domain-containing protein, partial [Ilumatobacter sp.]|uniref:LysM peptidoglycan-binding domain-containing protein n=1 Tax=Ilumatobacter sp. TaxID=1967498 RepID=UPI003C46659A
MTTQPPRLGRAVASIAALIVLFVVVPIGVVAATRFRFDTANPLGGTSPPWRWDADSIRDTLTAPLRDDALVDLMIRGSLILIWVALLVIAVTTVTEAVHMVRHRGLAAPHVRGLGWAQGMGRWIAIGLIALIPTNVLASGAQATPADAGPSATAHRLGGGTTRDMTDSPLPAVGRFGHDIGTPTSGDDDTPLGHSAPAVGIHVVVRGDSIYAIAAEYAGGDELRTIELADDILDLNLGTVMNDGQRFTNPALIQPGWRLELPAGFGNAEAQPADHDMSDDDPTPVRGIPRVDIPVNRSGPIAHVVVEDGDTLSGIATEHLAGPDDWPSIWERNRGADMGDGRTFDDPNTILPGWQLEIPADPDRIEPAPTPDGSEDHDSGEAATPDENASAPPPTAPVVTPTATSTPPTTTPSTTTPATSAPPPSTTTPAASSTTAASTTVPFAADAGDRGGGADPTPETPRAPS